jgi:hypothetical protein
MRRAVSSIESELAARLPKNSNQYQRLVAEFNAMGTWSPSVSLGGNIPPLPEMLDAANVDPGPALTRAVERGDRMFAVAANESVVAHARGSIHRSAIDYYRIGGADAKQRNAEAGQPLYDRLAEEAAARQKALAEAAAAELEKTSAEM